MNIQDAEFEYIEKCMERYTDSMIRAAYSILGSLAESEDSVQDTFIKLFRQKPCFNDEAHEKAWLLRVTINHAKNRLRQLKKLSTYEMFSENTLSDDSDQRAVREAICTLDEKYRIIVHLHYFEGYTVREISQILSIPLSTAGTRFERAKAQLRETLNMEGL